MQVSLFFYLFFRRIFAAVGFSFYDIKGYMCFFVCQRDVNPVWAAVLECAKQTSGWRAFTVFLSIYVFSIFSIKIPYPLAAS